MEGQPPPYNQPEAYSQPPPQAYDQPPPQAYGQPQYGHPQVYPQMVQPQAQPTTVIVTGGGGGQTVVVNRKERVNHVLHLIITILFWPWVFVWIILCLCG